MRLCYVLLSPTFGMHQYTADIANRMARAGHKVHLVTTRHFPRDRYRPEVCVHTPVETHNSGFSFEGLRWMDARAAGALLLGLRPDLVHLTGPHLWNPYLLAALRREGIPSIHTLHDLTPHSGAAYGPLLYGWNLLAMRLADHILVHGICFRERLLRIGMAPERVTYSPLLHLFLSAEALDAEEELTTGVTYEPWALFFGRLERYKGVADLLKACALLGEQSTDGPRIVLAGQGDLHAQWAGTLPPRVELRNRLIRDEEAADLFRRCGLLVLPYRDASQSALIAAAYFFRKPVLVTRTGALPEYVQPDHTGLVVAPGDPGGLARALDKVLADHSRLAQMGAAGRAWYDRQRLLEQDTLGRLYNQAVNDGSKAMPHPTKHNTP